MKNISVLSPAASLLPGDGCRWKTQSGM